MSRLVKCENGHFYDADKYAKCPNCSRGAGPKKDVVMEGGISTDLDDVKTVAMNIRGNIKSGRSVRIPKVSGRTVKPSNEILAKEEQRMRELQEKIKEMAKEYGIETKVKFLGLREDIPQLLQAMDLFLFPSLFEGLPVTLVEAQAAGLPCVISDMITDEIMITDQISKVSLSGNTSLWNQEIAKYRYSKRKNTIEDIIEHGFDIEKNARWLEEFYTNGK